MTKKAKQRSKPQARGPELTDEQLEGAVGGAGVAVGGTVLNATPLPPPVQSLRSVADAERGWRAIAARNGIENPRAPMAPEEIRTIPLG